MARRQGVPPRIPVPKGEFEGITEKGLHPDQLKVWITAFLGVAPSAWRGENADMARSFDRFLAKLDVWSKAQKAFAKQDFKTAISSLKMVCNLDPDDHAAKMNLASALASQGDAAGALKLLEGVRATFEGEADYHTMPSTKIRVTPRRSPTSAPTRWSKRSKPCGTRSRATSSTTSVRPATTRARSATRWHSLPPNAPSR
jgi:hypothetical protein